MSVEGSWPFSLPFVFCGDVDAAFFNFRLPRGCKRSRRRPRRARYACRHRGHYQNKQGSVNRARQRLGAFAKTHGELVGEIRHELDKQGAEKRAAKRSESAHDDSDEKGERQRKPEALR